MNEREIFIAALQKEDPAARQAYLKHACGADAALLARVEGLLKVYDRAGNFLQEPAAGAVGTGAYEESNLEESLRKEHKVVDSEQPGTILAGRYKLVERIGEGGMGEVWMAQQTEPVRRTVAVKVIKAGMDSKAVLARFDAERQALALMDHPNIARVLDAGTTTERRPFFVMELVKGVPITKFCDQRKLSPRERLELFVTVCQAVQHAHQKGVIHRDVKPSNVLVALYDDRPVAKVIDFGLAKATGAQLTQQSLMTGFGAVVGTPEYMSPEQASFNNLDIDTRSDVYGLGVLLYELLTGTTPVDRKSLESAALLEVLRIVREVEPPRPSVRLSSTETLASIAANRGLEPARLTKLLRGELDWIVMKALDKDRSRRYETANGLGRDIQRYLSDELVEARPPSAGYRLKKFVRRNRGQVVAASLIFLALVAGVIGTSWGLFRAEEAWQAETNRAEGERLAKEEAVEQKNKAVAAAEAERQAREAVKEVNQVLDAANEDLKSTNFKLDEARQEADAKRKQAEDERKIAQAVRNFLQHDLLRQADPTDQANRLLEMGRAGFTTVENPTIKELLDRTAQELTPEKIEQKLPGQPLVQAEILGTVGRTYIGTGDFSKAIAHLKRSRALYEAKLGRDHPDTLISMNGLALAYKSAGQFDLALPLYEETLKLNRAKLGPDHTHTLISMANLASGYQSAGKLDLALPIYEETLKLKKAKLGSDHADTLSSMNNLATGYRVAGKLDLALPLLEETLKLRTVNLGPDHPDTLISMNNLATGYRVAGKLDLALPLLGQTLTLMKAKLGPNHPSTLRIMHNLADCYRGAGKVKLALHLFEETLQLQKAKLGLDHPDTLTSMHNLAAGYSSAKQLDKSVPLFEEVLKLREQQLGRTHPSTISTVANLGVTYIHAGRLKDALPLLEEACQASRKIATLRWVRAELVGAYLKAGQSAAAAALVKEQVADAKKTHPNDSPQLAGELASVGALLLHASAFAESEPILRECLAIRSKAEPDSWTTFNTQSMLGGALLGQQKHAEAEPLLLAGYEGMKAREVRIPPQGKMRLTEAEGRLAELFETTHDKTESKIPGTLTSAKREAVHEVKLSADKAVVILMQTKDFDPLLRLTDGEGKTLAENGDIDPAAKKLNSRLWFMPEADGVYRIVATTYQQKGGGNYEIIIREYSRKRRKP